MAAINPVMTFITRVSIATTPCLRTGCVPMRDVNIVRKQGLIRDGSTLFRLVAFMFHFRSESSS
jgi:hypothetical protein